MKNKTVLITGATNGIGKAIAENLAENLASQGAELIIIGRNENKTKQVAKALQTKTQTVHYYVADLSSQEHVRTVSKQIKQDFKKLDVLINNAGAWFTTYQVSQDGIEMTWALNHLNYFLLTNKLMPLLQYAAETTGEARIINQSSSAHLEGQLHWDNLEFKGNWKEAGTGITGKGWAVYCQSKLANVLHAFTLARQLEGTGIVANAIHPGVVVTGFSQNNGGIYKLAAPIRKLFNNTGADVGAAPAIYLASADEARSISGTYFGPPQQQEAVNPLANDSAVQSRLWDISAAQVGL